MSIGPDHLLRVHTGEEPTDIDDDLPNAHLFRFEEVLEELAYIVQFLQDGKSPDGLLEKRKKILATKVAPYSLMNKSLYKIGHDDILFRCALPYECQPIINEAHG